MNYANIITDSFHVFWQHKKLWLWGMLLALVGQGEFSLSVSYQQNYSFITPTGGNPPKMPNPFDNPFVQSFLAHPLLYITGFSLLLLIWWLFSNIMGSLFHGALIGLVNEIDQNGAASLGSGWTIGKNRGIRLFSLTFLLALPTFIIMFPLALAGAWMALELLQILMPLFAANSPPSPQEMEAIFLPLVPYILGGFACFFPLICFIGLLNWGLLLLKQMAIRSCVLEDLGVVDSLKRGGQMTRRNVGYLLLNEFFIMAISGIFSLVGGIVALILWLVTASAIFNNDWSLFSIITTILLGVFLLMVNVGVGGILTTFNSVLWTKLYQGFVDKELSATLANITTLS